MRLTQDIIVNARTYYNPLRQYTLDLRGLKIGVMENLGAAEDRYDVIDLSDNSISVLENIPKFPRLETILLSNNLVSRIAGNIGSNIPNCRDLMLTNNRISSFEEIEHLKDWVNLSNLSLIDNPIESEPNFRVHVVKLLPQIKVLDFKKISQKEREEAAELP